ncbi:hypothetical protein [uncultured Thiodictyon sp.]|uniref:hypothetical protein n=1 Tax=uncultured Thiodictyon sp. TaxID=1846217 RepID=UPI0025D507EF|nr:hypothetical protein [uncultured Thiodictyon sp.]
MRPLAPPLNVIEAGLFAPLVQRGSAGVSVPGGEPGEARAAAAVLSTQPRPGLILQIDGASGPWRVARPLAVLLSEPAGHPDIWYGWLMAAETDYASPWDLVLEGPDAPYDPSAAMVQVWNPVHVDCPAARVALGELAPARLAAVRDLALELADVHPDPAGADPGTLVQRITSGGYPVLTGTPLGDGQDPRWRYHALYFAAADAVRDLARHALGELAPAPAWWQRVLAALRGAAKQWQLPLVLLPQPAMGPASPATTEPETWRLNDWLDLQFIPGSTGDALQIHGTLRAADPLTIALEVDGQARQQQPLDRARASGDLFAGAGVALTLTVRDRGGHCLFAAPLPDNAKRTPAS